MQIFSKWFVVNASNATYRSYYSVKYIFTHHIVTYTTDGFYCN